MKFVARLLFFLFIAFLLTPTVVTLLEEDCDISSFSKFSEEEHDHDKEVQVVLHTMVLFPDFLEIHNSKSSLIQSENLSKHDKVLTKIYCPPPDLA